MKYYRYRYIGYIFKQCNETHQENVINYLHKNAYICCDFKLSMNVGKMLRNCKWRKFYCSKNKENISKV